MLLRALCHSLVLALGSLDPAQQDVERILDRGEKLIEEAKTAYEEARSKNSVSAFVDAGFKLEEARIKFLVLQEIGSPEKQKIAADRMRAINQLSKLIHDGKVAISGAPANKPARPAPEDPSSPEPPPKPAAPAPRTAPDVTRRAAIPEAARQKDAEKLIRDSFKDQYAKKGPVERGLLAKALLEQAAKAADDPAVLWVLYREAQDAAVQACDPRTAIAAIESAARYFDVDAMSLKHAALTAVGKNAKTPVEFGTIADALLRLTDDFLSSDQYDSAEKAA